MKKTLFILGTMFILLLFACDFTLPSKVKIRASPSLEVAVNMNFSDKFSGILEDGFGAGEEYGVRIIDVNFPPDAPNIKTFLISVELYSTEIDLSKIDYLQYLVGLELPLDIDLLDYYLINPPEINLPLSEFNESSIGGFMFDEEQIKTHLLVSGSDIVSIFDVTLRVGDVEETHTINAPASGTDSDSDTVDSMPDGGIDLKLASILNERSDTKIQLFSISLREGEVIKQDWLDEPQSIKLEFVIWLPLIFKVDEYQSPAEFTIDGMDSLGEVVDAIAAAIPMEYLSLRVKMNENPFQAGELLIISGEDGREFTGGEMEDDALAFTFCEEDMDYINNNDFLPSFKIVFEHPGGFHVPNVFIIRTIALEMRFNHVIEL